MMNDSTVSFMNEKHSDHVEYLCDHNFNFATISGAFFILVFIFSIAGNGLLLCVLVVYESLKNVTNLFVLNLACSDLIFTVTLPFWATNFLHHWVFGDFCCKFMIAAYFVGLYSSVILLTAMTVDRFITVVLHNWPSNCVRRQRCAVGACAAAWVISIGASLSDAINVKAETNWDNLTTCGPSSDDKLGYYLQVSLLFFLPFVIIVFCYSAILKTVLQSANRKRHRTVVVVLCIVAAFFICWGPYNILLLIETLYTPESCDGQRRLIIAYYICQILAFSHCCMNPLLYLLSQKLRTHLLHLLRCEKLRMKKREKGITQDTSFFQNAMSMRQNSAVMLELQAK
ncbi:chemokine XC receptor 1 [Lates calcarifer]|uniref:Chemokine XC receptor 1 n=1 Tax=Lates calcarifer TaxID=8187 RepID=A0AAJ7LVQ2_LATCA|nr:chemokine XC receptor 1 [Lates calcarifer]